MQDQEIHIKINGTITAHIDPESKTVFFAKYYISSSVSDLSFDDIQKVHKAIQVLKSCKS